MIVNRERVWTWGKKEKVERRSGGRKREAGEGTRVLREGEGAGFGRGPPPPESLFSPPPLLSPIAGKNGRAAGDKGTQCSFELLSPSPAAGAFWAVEGQGARRKQGAPPALEILRRLLRSRAQLVFARLVTFFSPRFFPFRQPAASEEGGSIPLRSPSRPLPPTLFSRFFP